MAALAADLSPYLLRLAGLGTRLSEEGDITSFYKLHKETADRILACHPSQYSEILKVNKPTTQAAVVAAFSVLSMLLCPEGNIGAQYELAQEAHDWVWKAAKSFGIDMSEFYGNNDKPPSFSGNSGSGHVDSQLSAADNKGSSGIDSLTASCLSGSPGSNHAQSEDRTAKRLIGPPSRLGISKGSPGTSQKSKDRSAPKEA